MSAHQPEGDLSQAVIGVVGGMGPAATGKFLVELAERFPAEHDQDHPRVLVLSDTQVPDRTRAIQLGDTRPRHILERNLRTAIRLGASVLAVPCNTAHYFINQFQNELEVPLVHIVKSSLDAACAMSPEGAWLTATSGTISTGLYQHLAAERGYTLHVPTNTEVQELTRSILAVKSGRTEEAGSIYQQVAQAMLDRVDVPLITACTELPLAFEASQISPVRHISSITALVNATLAAAAGTSGRWPGEESPVAEDNGLSRTT